MSTSRLATLLLLGTGGALFAISPNRVLMAAATPPPTGGDVISTGTPVMEASTGILFPQLCNGYYLVGCGVRIKYGFIKVYALGTYLDPLAMSAVKKSNAATIQQALCDPTYPRTIRIVMARGLSIAKFTDAIVEALEPRMKGKDLDKYVFGLRFVLYGMDCGKIPMMDALSLTFFVCVFSLHRLEEFKKLNPPLDLVKGAEIEITIRGDTLLYKNAVGGVGTIRSEVFTTAMCDVYYGEDAVSPTHKAAVLEGVPKL